jgi:hypothetical protein
MSVISVDRRLSSRYGLRLRVRYRVRDGLKTLGRGTGLTSDISRAGIRFESQRSIPVDSAIELEVEWPVRLGGTLPLELRLTGSVVRCDEGATAVSLTTWQFRVAPSPKKRVPAREGSRGWVPHLPQIPPARDQERSQYL